MIYLALALSFITFLPPCLMSQGTNESNRTQETPAQNGISRSSNVAGAAPQSNLQASGESKCSAGFKECRESLNDFQEAEQFMQLKATVLADLNRLEESRPAKTKIATVYNADVNRQKTGNGGAYSATAGPNRISSVQATSAVQPVSLESAGETLKGIQ